MAKVIRRMNKTTKPKPAPLYQPLNVLKQIDDNIWIVDGDNINFYGIPFSTRMTIIRLANGDLFCHSPVALTPELKSAVEALGRVRHLVSPNWIHYAFMPQWSEAFADTIGWASPNVWARAKKYNIPVQFDQDLGDSAPAEWADEIDQLIAHGSPGHVEVVFFHKASRTLILTDLIENFEIEHMDFWQRMLFRLAGNVDPDGKAPVDMRLSFLFGHKRLARAVHTMLDWGPDRVVLAHGRWYQENGAAELRRAFRWVL